MSTVDALSGLGTGSSAPTRDGFSSLTSEDFAKIIFTELGKQDPLAPNDTNALIQQISGIRSIQSNVDLTDKLNDLVSQNEFAGAATLIGKTVSGLSLDLNRVSGAVKTVTRTTSGTLLTLNSGERMLIDYMDSVEQPAEAAGGRG